MKIKGKVEVYTDYGTEDQKLVCEDNNVVVDGAGEIIVDMLTTTPSLSGIPSAAAILDTSNYTIQAMTFGKDEEGYKRHAHTDSWSGLDYSWSTGASGGATPVLFSGAMVFTSSNANPTGGVSSYFPSGSHYNILPRYPAPNDSKLELNSETLLNTLVTQSNTYASQYPAASATFIQNTVNTSGYNEIGHNTNVLLDEIAAGFAPKGGTDSTLGVGLIQGAFPRGFQAGGTSAGIFSSVGQLSTGLAVGVQSLANLGDIGSSAVFYGNFNDTYVESMDISGYLGKVFNEYGIAGSGFTKADYPDVYSSGIVVSANVDFSSTGEVIYQTVIGAGDLGFTNFYGGIYNIGLWALDVKESLKTGMPPYAWVPRSNTRKYKLFSKKSFTKNLAYIQDSGTTNAGLNHYKDLTLIWRLYF
jgi:hypothetical protein